jgi:hypothetical protein
VSLACPWAHRTIIVRKLKGLETAIGMTVVDPVRDERGWAFRDGPGYSHDPLNGFTFLSEAYHARDPAYAGRVTVPVLWDNERKRIVSNSDDDIMRMLENAFDAYGSVEPDLYPAALRHEIDALNERIYETVNDGVYRAGFATSTSEPPIASSKRWTNSTRASRLSAICSVRDPWRRISAYSSRSSVSMRSTSAISNAICVASWITRICRVTSATSTNIAASVRRSISITSSGITITRTTISIRPGSCRSGRCKILRRRTTARTSVHERVPRVGAEHASERAA